MTVTTELGCHAHVFVGVPVASRHAHEDVGMAPGPGPDAELATQGSRDSSALDSICCDLT